MADNKTQIVITAKDETRAAIASAQSGLQSLSATAATIGLQLGALGGIGSVGGLALMAQDAINAADNLGKMAQKVGVTVEALSALEYAGKLSDVSLEALGTGLKKLSLNMAEAASGSGETAGVFKALGINVKDAAGNLKSSDAVLADIADKFADMEDGAGKTAIAMKLFGKSGADLIPLLNQGSKGLSDMRVEAEKLGAVFGKDLAQKAEAFNDNITRLNTSIDGLKIALASGVIEDLLRFSDALVAATKASGNVFSGFALLDGAQTSNPVKALEDIDARLIKLKKTRDEIAGSTANKSVFRSVPIIGTAEDLAILEKQISFAETQRVALADLAKQRGAFDFGPPVLSADKNKAPGLPGDSKAAGKADKSLDALDVAYGGYKGAYKEFSEAIKRQAADAEAAAVAEVKLEEEKQKRIESILKETYDYKLAIHHKELQAAVAALDEGLINEEQWAEFAQVRIDAFNKVKDEGTEAFKELEHAIEGWGKASADAFVEFAFTGKASFSDMVQSILKDMAKMVVYQNVTSPIAKSISKGIEDSGGIGGFLSGIFGGGRANGGPVTPGNYYVVGENGPEILVPNMSGTVIPNGGGMGGGGITSNVTVNMSTGSGSADGDAGTARDLSRRIETAVRGVLMVEQRPGGLLA